MPKQYETPQVRLMGTVEELTQGPDKIGSVADELTPTSPLGLDGTILPGKS